MGAGAPALLRALYRRALRQQVHVQLLLQPWGELGNLSLDLAQEELGAEELDPRCG